MKARPYAPLALEDYAAIRAQLCESHPGVWLHHYGPAVEAEVLKRLQLANGNVHENR